MTLTQCLTLTFIFRSSIIANSSRQPANTLRLRKIQKPCESRKIRRTSVWYGQEKEHGILIQCVCRVLKTPNVFFYRFHSVCRVLECYFSSPCPSMNATQFLNENAKFADGKHLSRMLPVLS